jgi:ribosomal protein S18 acetylase RimI-like enzyme
VDTVDSAIVVREAVCADAEAIARVHVASWRTTYRGIMPDAVLDGLSVAERQGMWEQQLCEGRSDLCIYVAASTEAQVIGFASGGRPQAEIPGYDAELHTVYLLAEHQGKGVGRRLMGAVARCLHARGARRLVLWVLADNQPSRRFYEGLGGVVVTQQPFEIGGATLDEVAYGYDLSALTTR